MERDCNWEYRFDIGIDNGYFSYYTRSVITLALSEVWNYLSTGGLSLVLLLSLVQISPIKLNPWDSIFSWLGKKLNRETDERIATLQTQVQGMWINSHRHTILRFARECRAGIDHSPDVWTNVLNVAEEYEAFVHENSVTNGIITQDTVYLRNLYQKLSHEHKL